MDKESLKLIRWILKVTVGTLASICVCSAYWYFHAK
jgi:hypothetical protein